MKTELAHQIREILSDYLKKHEVNPDQLKLRAPRQLSWGDVTSNVLQLTSVEKESDNNVSALVEQINSLPQVKQALVSDSRDLNIWFKASFWCDEMNNIVESGLLYGGKFLDLSEISLNVPPNKEDLLSLKSHWNADALSELGSLFDVKVEVSEGELHELRGFRSDGALSRCGEQALKIALLSTDDEFAIHFSPVKALDRSYANPVFSLPYTEATIRRLLEKAETEKVLHLGEDDSDKSVGDLSRPEEKELCQHLVSWPMVLKKCFDEKDMVNLTGFLQRASLLFFDLYDAQRPQ